MTTTEFVTELKPTRSEWQHLSSLCLLRSSLGSQGYHGMPSGLRGTKPIIFGGVKGHQGHPSPSSSDRPSYAVEAAVPEKQRRDDREGHAAHKTPWYAQDAMVHTSCHDLRLIDGAAAYVCERYKGRTRRRSVVATIKIVQAPNSNLEL